MALGETPKTEAFSGPNVWSDKERAQSVTSSSSSSPTLQWVTYPQQRLTLLQVC